MEQLSKELGVTTFKLFMSQKGRLMLDNNEMMEAFKHIKDIGGVAKVSFGDFIIWKHKKLTFFFRSTLRTVTSSQRTSAVFLPGESLDQKAIQPRNPRRWRGNDESESESAEKIFEEGVQTTQYREPSLWLFSCLVFSLSGCQITE